MKKPNLMYAIGIASCVLAVVACTKTELEPLQDVSAANQSFVQSSESALIEPDPNPVIQKRLVEPEFNLQPFENREEGCPPKGTQCKRKTSVATPNFEDEMKKFEKGVLNGPITLKAYYEQEEHWALKLTRPDIYSDFTSGEFSAIKEVYGEKTVYFFGKNPTTDNFTYNIIVE